MGIRDLRVEGQKMMMGVMTKMDGDDNDNGDGGGVDDFGDGLWRG